MSDIITLTYTVSPDDFTRAGEASSNVKHKLKQIGVAPAIVRRVAIAMYEGEINMVIHASGGEITVTVSPERYVPWCLEDRGPRHTGCGKGHAGRIFHRHRTMSRSLGFGAGMGLPNMKKYTDDIKIDTELGVGTTVTMVIHM